MRMVHKKPNKNGGSTTRPTNPYISKPRHPGLSRLLDIAKQGASAGAAVPARGDGGNGDGGDTGETGSGGAIDAPTRSYLHGATPPLMATINPEVSYPDHHLPPSPSGTAATTAAGDGDDGDGGEVPTDGVYDELTKLHPDTIIDKKYLAKISRVGEKTIRRRIKSGELPPTSEKLGRQPGWFVGVLLDWRRNRAKRLAEQEEHRRQHIRNRTE